MKRLIVAVLFLAHASAEEPPQPSGNKVGRFRVVHIEDGTRKGTMRIDTATGKTWVLGTPEGGGAPTWVEAKEAKPFIPPPPIPDPGK
jgi:hypothetical protein